MMKNNLDSFNDKYDVQKFDWGELIWLHEPKNLLTERLSAGLVKFFPGKSQLSHIHFGEEQILYVLSGEGIHILNGEKKNINKDMLIHCPGYSEHEVENTGTDNLVFLIIYTPSKLMEMHQNLPIMNNKHILDVLEKDVLQNIQKEISELLQLSITIVDNDNINIIEPININRFCNLFKRSDVCQDKNKKDKVALKELDTAFVCCNNIITIIIPIMLNNQAFGYIKCGHFILNKSTDVENILLNKIKGNINKKEIISAYNDIEIIPKSRLYAIEETLSMVSKLITNIMENNIVEKAISEKNDEIMKNTIEKHNLENALKQANIKILKSQVSSNFQNYNINLKTIINKENLEYPLDYENKLKNAIKKFDKTLSIDMTMEIIKLYEEKAFSVHDVKEIFQELIIILCRVVYEEAKDSEMLLEMRHRYKYKVKNCNNYSDLQKTIIELSKESIIILEKILLNGKYELINKINLYLENNFHQNITLGYLANVFFISPNYLSTIFNEKNGISLKNYINRLRIKKAKQYLEDSDIKILEISRMVGYSQLSYFGSVFNKLENCTPNEYRTNAKSHEN